MIIGKWDHHKRYGVEASYEEGMKWLAPCSLVEDWGCGPAYSRNYRRGAYRGVDGTAGYCDVVADLREYRSTVPGIFMRHVLEHNHDWKPILENALASFAERMSLIFFTPWADKTYVVHMTGATDIPVISFRKQDILDYISPYLVGEQTIHRKDKPLYDTIFRLAKNAPTTWMPDKKNNYGETDRRRNPGEG